MTIAGGYDALEKANEGLGVITCQLESNYKS